MGLLSFIRSNRRVGAILTVCQDFRRGKGGKPDAAPRHPDLDVCLREHIDGAGLTSNPKAPLFLSCSPAGRLAGNPLPRTFSSRPRPTSPARVTSSVAGRRFGNPLLGVARPRRQAAVKSRRTRSIRPQAPPLRRFASA
jgi:hypothetical protein